jgi:hypothetical protein
VCRSGGRSGKACEELTALGLGPVVNLAGGMIAWKRERFPVERTEPASLVDLLDAGTHHPEVTERKSRGPHSKP